MPEKKTTVQLPPPIGTVDGFEVPILESNEKWTEIKLEDGTILRVKPNALSVVRINGQYDQDGNPMYVLRSSQIMTVTNVSDHLRKGARTTGKIQ